MGLRFNPPPNWPMVVSRGWRPTDDWQPDPSWPSPPPGWRLWVPDETSARRARRRQAWRVGRGGVALAALAVLAVVTVNAIGATDDVPLGAGPFAGEEPFPALTPLNVHPQLPVIVPGAQPFRPDVGTSGTVVADGGPSPSGSADAGPAQQRTEAPGTTAVPVRVAPVAVRVAPRQPPPTSVRPVNPPPGTPTAPAGSVPTEPVSAAPPAKTVRSDPRQHSKNQVSKNHDSRNQVSRNQVSRNQVSRNQVSRNQVSRNQPHRQRRAQPGGPAAHPRKVGRPGAGHERAHGAKPRRAVRRSHPARHWIFILGGGRQGSRDRPDAADHRHG